MQASVCKNCENPFEITKDDLRLYELLAPQVGELQLPISLPSHCPDCRQQRRAAWRNERSLYSTTCDRCNERIISIYSPDKPFTVYCQSCWWSDEWDPLQFGREFEPGKSLFAQYQELQRVVPRMALYDINSENDSYCNHSANNKSCYMGVGVGDSEECLYGKWVLHSFKCIDCYQVQKCTSCYECSYCQNCYQSAFCEYSENLSDCWHCFECRKCDSCLGCMQLQNKRYHVLNKPVSKEQFEQTKELLTRSPEHYAKFKQAYQQLKQQAVTRFSHQIRCESSTGENLTNCKNAQYCFDCTNLEDCRHMYDLGNNKNSMDCFEHGWLVPSELNYECHAGMAGYNLLFCNVCAYSNSLLYSDHCFNSCDSLFACIGLRKAQYCILNRPYTREEYEQLVLEIVTQMQRDGEWGEFFPMALSPFGYNESVAQEYFPMSQEQVRSKGLHWSDFEAPAPKVSNSIAASELPADSRSVTDELAALGVICETSAKPFRITTQELAFHRASGVPLPKHHPIERHHARLAGQAARKLYQGSCVTCRETLLTTYAPGAQQKLLCERCYQDAVF